MWDHSSPNGTQAEDTETALPGEWYPRTSDKMDLMLPDEKNTCYAAVLPVIMTTKGQLDTTCGKEARDASRRSTGHLECGRSTMIVCHNLTPEQKKGSHTS